MPHLAPFSWLPIALIFWASMILLVSFSWWSQSPSFPSSSVKFKKQTPRQWPWN